MFSFAPSPTLAALAFLLVAGMTSPAAEPSWRAALTFHASFDDGTDADFAKGDRRLYHAPTMSKRAEARVGLPAESTVKRVPGQGKFGAALQFQRKSEATAYYQVADNFAYRTNAWGGTVSFWLSTDPAGDLAPGYCDPLQITPRAWNDAAFFVEFEKRPGSIPFRLGAYPDFKIWNPENRKWETMSASEKPLLTVDQPPFGRERWTHVVFTFEHYNTRRPDGVTRLYLNGRLQQSISAREQTFTWDPAKAHVMLGLSYVGLFDELSLFDRALSAEEIASLHQLPKGVRGLLKAKGNE